MLIFDELLWIFLLIVKTCHPIDLNINFSFNFQNTVLIEWWNNQGRCWNNQSKIRNKWYFINVRLYHITHKQCMWIFCMFACVLIYLFIHKHTHTQHIVLWILYAVSVPFKVLFSYKVFPSISFYLFSSHPVYYFSSFVFVLCIFTRAHVVE